MFLGVSLVEAASLLADGLLCLWCCAGASIFIYSWRTSSGTMALSYIDKPDQTLKSMVGSQTATPRLTQLHFFVFEFLRPRRIIS